MNLILVGSCLDSSALAGGLNERLSNSLVYRHDLLASLKNIPSGINLNNEVALDVGKYLGDIEAISFDKTKKETLDMLRNTFKFLSKSRTTAENSFEKMLIRESLNKFSKRVIVFDSVSFSIVNIFSGILNKEMLEELVSSIEDTLIINISQKDNPFFDINVTEKEINDIVNNSEKCIFLGTFKDVNNIISSNEFKTLFSDIKEIEEKVKQKETKANAEIGTGVEEEVVQMTVPHIPHPIAMRPVTTMAAA